jgi:hypothetical protein
MSHGVPGMLWVLSSITLLTVLRRLDARCVWRYTSLGSRQSGLLKVRFISAPAIFTGGASSDGSKEWT